MVDADGEEIAALVLMDEDDAIRDGSFVRERETEIGKP